MTEKEFDRLEFSIFCIENVAIRLGCNGRDIYLKLKDSNLLESYIMANYEVLHTQGKDYIVDDIIDVMKEETLI